MATVKDPVCGMDIETSGAAATSDYEGVTYYFCSVGCQQLFAANPVKFVETAGAPAQMPMAPESSRQEPMVAGAGSRKWWQFWKS